MPPLVVLLKYAICSFVCWLSLLVLVRREMRLGAVLLLPCCKPPLPPILLPELGVLPMPLPVLLMPVLLMFPLLL